MKDAALHVTKALHEIITNPLHDEAAIRRFFAAEYQQYVDGKHLDFAGFIGHMAVLKQLTERMELTLLAIAGQGNEVLTHHQVTVVRKAGTRPEIEVFAHFTLQDGLIIRCAELTRLVRGAAEDHQLGSLQ